MATSLDVDNIATHADLELELGDASRLTNLLPKSASGESTAFRQRALEDVIEKLRDRVPPIADTDLSHAEEDLKRAVIYGTLVRLYTAKVGISGDHWDINRKLYTERFASRVNAIQPRTPAGKASTGIGIVMERR